MDKEAMDRIIADLGNMTDEQLMEAFQKAGTGEVKTPEPVKQETPPVSYTMSDGTVLSAPNADELSKMIQAHRPAPVQTEAPKPASPAFDMKLYHEKLIQDPQAAQDYMETARYGAPLSQVLPIIGTALKTYQERLSELESARFASTVEDPKARKVVDDVVAQYGWTPNQKNREAAYELAKAKGLLEPTETKTKSDTFIPPRTGGGRPEPTSDTDLKRHIENMSLSELHQAMLDNKLLTH